MSEVGRRLGYEPATLYALVPDLCYALSDRYMAFAKAQADDGRNYGEEVQEIAYNLHAQGIYPSCDAITERINQPWYRIDPNAINIWRKVLKKLGWEK